MATKLKDIPFETLVPVIVPTDELPTHDEAFNPEENLVAVVGARSIEMLDSFGCYRLVVSPDYQGDPDMWFFNGVADHANSASEAGNAGTACWADCASMTDYANYAGYADCASDAGQAGYACCADFAYATDYACEADYAYAAGMACYAECSGSAAGADYAGHANTADQLGVSGANMYACGGDLMVGGIDGHYGRLAVMSVSDLQGASPCTYVLVVEG